MNRSGGFTITESMLFLAISASTIFIALALFSGARKNHFNLAMRDLDSFFQDVINDVSTGYFTSGNITCVNQNQVGAPPTFLASEVITEQGTNSGCINLGKVIMLAPFKSASGGVPPATQEFEPANSPPVSSGDTNKIVVVPVAGNRLSALGSAATSVDPYDSGSARPTIVWQDSILDGTIMYSMKYAIELKSAYIIDPAGSPYGVSPGNSTPQTVLAAGAYVNLAGSAVAKSGVKTVSLQPHDIYQPEDVANLKRCVESTPGSLDGPDKFGHCFEILPPHSSWVMCFWSANHDETAQIEIKGSSSNGGLLQTKLEFIKC